MATSGSGGSCWSTPEVHKHHEQKIVCHTRPKYREGRRLRAVKVYTINLESRFLLVQGVPALGAMKELVELMALYGPVEEYRVLDEYPAEQFTEVYLFKFRTLRSARMAKRNLDERSFFGGLLHVCYAPEYETVEDTRQKLQDRRRYVARAKQNKVKALDEPEEKIERNAAEDSTCEIPKPENERGSWDFRERETWNEKGSWDLSYPLLPLPPQEGFPSVFEQTVYEDSMGSTYSAGTSDQPIASVGQKCSSDRSTVVYIKVKDRPPPAKLIPRTAHLQNRKRKMEEASKAFLLGTTEKNDTLIGPKLPELPKVDMEDDSLNITVNLIRSTMAKVSTIPENKATEKSSTATKPRRRI
ncbi:RNA-binding protein 48 [Scleropages formosus]|uniref:RNA-binding protein 48 n=1 Tax=Scleropages formosus TaxID=113540 RepID=A0A8C9TE19_SCLFO|nr:RNA-binding protein 48 [Scleropages formosus]